MSSGAAFTVFHKQRSRLPELRLRFFFELRLCLPELRLGLPRLRLCISELRLRRSRGAAAEMVSEAQRLF